jgi:hypothetical protein
MGFDYCFGFGGGDASQWRPSLFRNTTASVVNAYPRAALATFTGTPLSLKRAT